MPIPGFADYSRLTNSSGNQLAAFQVTPFNNTVTGAIDCLGYAGVDISINSLGFTVLYWVQVTWYADPALTVQITSNAFTPVTPSQMVREIPVHARYMKLQTFYISGSNTDNFPIVLFGKISLTDNAYPEQPAEPFIWKSLTLPAGNQDTTNATTMWEGSAIMSGNAALDAHWDMFLEYFDKNTSTWKAFTWTNGNGTQLSNAVQVALPPAPVRMNFGNSSTAAQLCTYSLIPF